jgi:peptidoglycan/LPS O-acetylase OafA/YrhL
MQQKLSNLQIARAVASTSVVYFHIRRSPVFGSFGVDIFFVLSGFVIAMVVERGESAATFAANRISRIVPLYWLLTLGVFAVGSFSPSMLHSTTANAEQLVKSITFIPFFRANGDLYPLLGVGWSLNYEMFFYGCVLVAIVSQRRRWMLITTVLMMAAYLGLGILLDNRVTNEFFGTVRLAEFLFGCFHSGSGGRVAWQASHRPWPPRRHGLPTSRWPPWSRTRWSRSETSASACSRSWWCWVPCGRGISADPSSRD